MANIPCLDGRTVAADLSAALGLPVWVYNDADCFALAEALLGAGVGIARFSVRGDPGHGGRRRSRAGRTHRDGAGGFAGEWGHGPAVNGAVAPWLDCGCGLQGCLDTVGGARGIERLHRHLAGEEVTSLPCWNAGAPVTPPPGSHGGGGLGRCAERATAMVLNVTGASAVPVGGGLSNAPDLIARLDEAVRGAGAAAGGGPVLRVAELTVEPGLVAAHWPARRRSGVADIRLEVCVTTADSLAAAVAGRADRIELCAALDRAGLTPSPGAMRAAAGCARPVFALIRPRPGISSSRTTTSP